MKAIFAYIARDSVAAVVDAVRSLRLRDVSVVEIRAALWPVVGDERFHLPQLGGASVADAKLEILCEDAELSAVVNAIHRVVHGRNLGNGSVYVLPVDVLRAAVPGEPPPIAQAP
jgi:nitrogen regulatory protein PII